MGSSRMAVLVESSSQCSSSPSSPYETLFLPNGVLDAETIPDRDFSETLKLIHAVFDDRFITSIWMTGGHGNKKRHCLNGNCQTSNLLNPLDCSSDSSHYNIVLKSCAAYFYWLVFFCFCWLFLNFWSFLILIVISVHKKISDVNRLSILVYNNGSTQSKSPWLMSEYHADLQMDLTGCNKPNKRNCRTSKKAKQIFLVCMRYGDVSSSLEGRPSTRNSQ